MSSAIEQRVRPTARLNESRARARGVTYAREDAAVRARVSWSGGGAKRSERSTVCARIAGLFNLRRGNIR